MKKELLFLILLFSTIALHAAWLTPSEYQEVNNQALNNLDYAIKKGFIDPQCTYVVMYNLFQTEDLPPYSRTYSTYKTVAELADCSYNGWRYSFTRLLHPEDWFNYRTQWKKDLYKHLITINPTSNFPPDTSSLLNEYLAQAPKHPYEINAISVEALIKYIIPYLYEPKHNLSDLVLRVIDLPIKTDGKLNYKRVTNNNENYYEIQLIKSLTEPLVHEVCDDNRCHLNDGIKNFLHKFEYMDRNNMGQEINNMKNALSQGNIFHADPTFAYLIVDKKQDPLVQRNVTKRVLLITALGLGYYYRKPLWALGKVSLNYIKNQLGYL